MNDNVEKHIDKLMNDLDKELNSFEDWINWHIKLLDKKYPERSMDTMSKSFMMSIWENKQIEHRNKVRELHKEFLTLYFS